MSHPVLAIWNQHSEDCGEPPALTNKTEPGARYYGYFENRFGEQLVFVYDRKRKTGELRGGDIGWERVVPVRDGQPEDMMLGKDEAAWLAACWKAVTR